MNSNEAKTMKYPVYLMIVVKKKIIVFVRVTVILFYCLRKCSMISSILFFSVWQPYSWLNSNTGWTLLQTLEIICGGINVTLRLKAVTPERWIQQKTAAKGPMVWINCILLNWEQADKKHCTLDWTCCTVSFYRQELLRQPGSTAVTKRKPLLSRLCCLSAVRVSMCSCW